MSAESDGIDPYDAVLADLRAKRDQIDQAIQAIESLRGGGSPPSASANGGPTTTSRLPGDEIEGPGALLGMSIADAAKKLLAAKRKPLKNSELAVMFKAGGLHLTSRDPVNTIGTVMMRRFQEVGDVVRVDRGTWGLKEWYPGRSFKWEGTVKTGTPEPSPDNGQPSGED